MNDLISTRDARVGLGLRPGEWLYLSSRFVVEFPRPTFLAGRAFWSPEDLEKIRELRARIRPYGKARVKA